MRHLPSVEYAKYAKYCTRICACALFCNDKYTPTSITDVLTRTHPLFCVYVCFVLCMPFHISNPMCVCSVCGENRRRRRSNDVVTTTRNYPKAKCVCVLRCACVLFIDRLVYLVSAFQAHAAKTSTHHIVRTSYTLYTFGQHGQLINRTLHPARASASQSTEHSTALSLLSVCGSVRLWARVPAACFVVVVCDVVAHLHVRATLGSRSLSLHATFTIHTLVQPQAVYYSSPVF